MVTINKTLKLGELHPLFDEKPAIAFGSVPFVPVGLTVGNIVEQKVAVLLCAPVAMAEEYMTAESFGEAIISLEEDEAEDLLVVFSTVGTPRLAFPISRKGERFIVDLEADSALTNLIGSLIERVNELSAMLYTKEKEGA